MFQYPFTWESAMSDLRPSEKAKLEKLLQMGAGYVLGFSNNGLQTFVAEAVDIDLYDQKYAGAGTSKANRLKEFWKLEPNDVVGKALKELVDLAASSSKDAALVAECRKIIERLTGEPVGVPAKKVPVSEWDIEDVAIEQVKHAKPAVKGSAVGLAFISYSWDSEQHKTWTREFGEKLIDAGIDVILDQWDLKPGGDRFHFMETSVRRADAVLCVCTPNYVQKANDRSSGVGVEVSLMTPKFFDRVKKQKQFIPIIRDGDGQLMPDFLDALVFVDFRKDVEFADKMEELLRHLHDEPKHRKPPLGEKPKF